jgi:hypothetical protein
VQALPQSVEVAFTHSNGFSEPLADDFIYSISDTLAYAVADDLLYALADNLSNPHSNCFEDSNRHSFRRFHGHLGILPLWNRHRN